MSFNAEARGSFIADVGRLVTGTTAAQIVGVAAAPVLARLYDPGAWGTASVFASALAVALVVVSLRYDLAVLLPRDDAEAANVLAAGVVAACLVSLLVAMVCLGAPDLTITVLGPSSLRPILWVLPPVLLIAGLAQALSGWLSRVRRYGELSIVRAVQSLSTVLGQVALAVGGAGTAAGLIWGAAAGTVLAFLLVGWFVWARDGARLRAYIHWSGIWHQAREFRRFPFIDVGGSLVSVLAQMAPVFVLGWFYTAETVGQYSLAMRLLLLPMGLVGGAVGQVYFQRAAEAQAHGEPLYQVTTVVAQRLVRWILVPAAVLTVAGRELFVAIFGAEWSDAGAMVEILGVWTFFSFVGGPLTMVFAVRQAFWWSLAVHGLLLVTRVLPLLIGGLFWGPLEALWAYSVVGILGYAIVIGWSLRQAQVSASSLVWSARRPFVEAAVSFALLLAAQGVGVPPLGMAVIAGLVMAAHGWNVIRVDGLSLLTGRPQEG